jgi:hypothetical protein
MATRRESVELSLNDVDFTSGMARAAASTALLSRELHGLDGSSVKASRSTEKLGDNSGGIAKTGTQARKSSADLNQFTGRLSLLATAATTIGPALLPIGAVAIPAVTALAGGLGAAVGAVGTAVLAFHGLGDSLKALDAYQLEPTDANLQKLHDTLGKLSPAAQDLVMRLDSLEPVLKRLQTTAQENMFPGVNEGLDEIMTLVPMVQDVVGRLATEMGTLTADAGASLAHDPDWQRFFEFVRTDAAPTLDAFARATGNVIAGLGSMLVAFQPLSDGFTSGMLDMSRSFREWAANLSSSDGFREFTDYIRENGPAVGDFLAAIASALIGVARAAAPWGSIVLPVLTDVAHVFGVLADSPIGPALFTAAAGALAISRTAAGLSAVSTSLGRIGTDSEKASKGLGGLGAKAGTILLLGQALGSLANQLNLGANISTADLPRDIDNIVKGGTTKSLKELAGALEGVNEAGSGTISTVLSIPGSLVGMETSFQKSNKVVDEFDQQLAQLVESGQADKAAELFTRIREAAAGHGGVSDADVVKSFDSYRTALENVDASAGNARHGADLFTETLGLTGDKANTTAAQIGALNTALGNLNGWLDKRSALRNYQQSLDDFTASVKKNGDNFDIASDKGRANQAALDGMAGSIAQVASQIKDPGRKSNFIKAAISDLRSMASKASPEAAAAIRGVIRKLKELGGTPAKPKVKVDNGAALAAIAAVDNRLMNLDGKTATVTSYFRTIYTQTGKPTAKTDPTLGGLIPRKAEGGPIYGPGTATSDSIPAYLSNGEYVVKAAAVAKYGTSLFDGLNAMRLAGGGFASLTGPGVSGGSSGNPYAIAGQYGIDVDHDDKLRRRLALFGKALDNAKSALEKETSARDSLTSSISGNLTGGLFDSSSSGSAFSQQFASGSLGATNAKLQQQIRDARDQAALERQLRARGVSGAALQDVIQNGGISALRQFAQGSNAQLAQYQSLYGQRTTAVAGAASAAADVLGMTSAINNLRGDVHVIAAAIKAGEKAQNRRAAQAKKDRAANAKATGKHVASGLNAAAKNSKKR